MASSDQDEEPQFTNIAMMPPEWFEPKIEHPLRPKTANDAKSVDTKSPNANAQVQSPAYTDKVMIDSGSIVGRLLNGAGTFDHILENIFLYLDGNSLAAAADVSENWRQYVEGAFWSKPAKIKQINYQWSAHLPMSSIKFHGAEIISMKCNGGIVACGEKGTGNIAIYNRRDIARKTYLDQRSLADHFSKQVLGNTKDTTITPIINLNAHERSVMALDLNEYILVSAGFGSEVKVWDMRSGQLMATLFRVNCRVNAVRLMGKRSIFVGSNNVVMIYRIEGNLATANDITFRYDGYLSGHDGEILCMDHNGELLGTGSADRTVKLWSGVQGTTGTTAGQQTLTGHDTKVKCLAMTATHVASGSWDRTCRVWLVRTGECVRVLKHEAFVRSVAMDNYRIATGDVCGLVYVWTLPNVLNPAMGPGVLCLRAHNAIDSDRPMEESHKWVNGVHLETSVLIAVAGKNGRIGIQDFWKDGGKDVYMMESFGQDHSGEFMIG